MNRLPLNNLTVTEKRPQILIFTEGTIIGPRRLFDFFSIKKYVPIKNCIHKITSWEKQGAQISYLTSRKNETSANIVKDLLKRYNFPGTYLYYREHSDKYKDIVERLIPDVLIEDDCKSIGGAWQMSITFVENKIKDQIKSIVVKEFKGIDNLPDNYLELVGYREK
jgi:hypothetical protein